MLVRYYNIGFKLYVDILTRVNLSPIQLSNMDLVYRSVRSSSRRWMGSIIILASCEHNFIRLHDNLVHHPSNNISILKYSFKIPINKYTLISFHIEYYLLRFDQQLHFQCSFERSHDLYYIALLYLQLFIIIFNVIIQKKNNTYVYIFSVWR